MNHQITVTSLEIEDLDRDDLVERDAESAVDGGADALADLLQKLIFLRFDRILPPIHGFRPPADASDRDSAPSDRRKPQILEDFSDSSEKNRRERKLEFEKEKRGMQTILDFFLNEEWICIRRSYEIDGLEIFLMRERRERRFPFSSREGEGLSDTRLQVKLVGFVLQKSAPPV